MNIIKAHFQINFPSFHLDTDLEVPAKGVTVIFGPSGCGKTTFLKCIAGLIRSPNGYFQLGEETWQDETKNIFLPVHEREIGMVFQEARLFSHISVESNLKYGLKRIPISERRVTWEQIINIMDLGPLLKRSPQKLSGGEQQRVAIGRALLTSPKILLMDEPLANLDTTRKLEIIPFLTKLKEELGIPIFYVSHSLNEVLQIMDTLVLIGNGKIIACGPANQVMAQTNLPQTASFNFRGSILETKVVDHDTEFNLTRVQFRNHFLYIPQQPFSPGQTLRLHVLAKDISIHLNPPQGPTSVLNILSGTVLEIGMVDSKESSVEIKLNVGEPILATITRKSLHHLGLKIGQRVYLYFKAVKMVHEMEENQ